MFCILIPMRALPPYIQSKSRMRERARTDLCGGRRAIGVPTATRCLGQASNKASAIALSYSHETYISTIHIRGKAHSSIPIGTSKTLW